MATDLSTGTFRPQPACGGIPVGYLTGRRTASQGIATLYRARFFGHKIALSSGTHDRLRPGCSGIARTTQAVLLDQPVGVVAGNEVAAGVTDLVDGLVARFMAKAIARSGPGCGSWVSGLRSAGCSGLWARMTC